MQNLLGRRRIGRGLPGVAAFLGVPEKFFHSGGVAGIQAMLELAQIIDENAEDAGEIAGIGERDVAPHFGRTRSDASGVAEAGGADLALLGRVRGAQDIIG